MNEQDELRLELKRDFRDFLEHDFGAERHGGKYVDQIRGILKNFHVSKAVRLDVDLQGTCMYALEAEDLQASDLKYAAADLADFNEDLHGRTMSSPVDCLPAFEDALEAVMLDQEGASKILEGHTSYNVTFSGEFGANKVTPRCLCSTHLGRLVEVKGIVTKCTLVRPKMVKSVHYCPTTGATTSREYRDVTSNRGLPTPTVYPTRDTEGNLLTTQFGLCTFIDQQVLTVQELPETAPPGQLPRSVDIVLESDLRDAAKPGDRVSCVGIYKPVPPRASGSISGVFRALLVANGVRLLNQEATGPTFTENDYDNITELATEDDVIDQLAASLAPSIYGYSWIKKALVLLLAGGRERTLQNGTHLRGDVNCLLVGDPGVAKSQLLRAVMNIAPLCVSTTGRGSSGVGLTAAVVTDQDTGERRLEAGAMVLADRGVVCIDEFDKMNDGDRVAIHEVMEQQTVTIAKAGILTQLNARCSVVAAANPIYGHYDRTISITRNIGLPDSLLSRFDLLFVVLDNNDATRDREIADHVLGQHRYRPSGDDGTSVQDDMLIEELRDDQDDENAETPMRVKYDSRLYGPRVRGSKDPLSIPFLKKYLAFAKQRFSSPEMTPEASEAIAEYYADLRNSSEVQALPVTVRTLETIIRLACAHAKVRLSPFVELKDVEEVQSIVDMILKSDPSATNEKPGNHSRRGDRRTKRARDDEDDDDDDDDDMSEDLSDDEEEEARTSREEPGRGSAQVSVEDIRSVVMELGHLNSGSASITGVIATLKSRKIEVTREAVVSVLNELESADKITMEGEDFYLST